MWIDSAKNNETKHLDFESYKEPIKSLGINLWLYYKHENKHNLFKFLYQHFKMDTNVNIIMANKRPNSIWKHKVD